MSGNHYQCRFAKRLDGRKVITWPELGSMYAHGQKTLKSYHTLDEAIAAAKESNRSLPPRIIGLVIVQFKKGHARIYTKPSNKSGVRGEPRKVGTTEWLRFIDKDNRVFELDHKNHVIGRELKDG